MTSIIIPAHNEARVIGRLLGQVLESASPDEFDIVVVANGCTDHTAEVAASFGGSVRVVSTPMPSKRQALLKGNHAAKSFPRLYVDADVELRTEDIRALREALQRPGVLAVSAHLTHNLAGCSWPIHWYYSVWTQLPGVQHGLFGRGVVGVNEAGYARIADLAQFLADDLAMSLVFSFEERKVVSNATVIVHPPRTFSGLLRSRTRVAMGVKQIEESHEAPRSTARTRPSDLLALVRRDQRVALKVTFFLAVAALSRFRARREIAQSGYSRWLRDETSRTAS